VRNARSLKRLVCLLVTGLLLGLAVSCAASEIEKPATASLPKTPQLSDLEQRNTVSQYGITWTFDKAVPVGQFVTGDYYVVGPVTVVDITPKPVLDRSGGVESAESLDSRGWMSKRNVKVKVKARNGSMLNLQVEREKTGFDSRAPGKRFDASLFTPLPIKMVPGDSLVSTISAEKTRTTPRMLDTDVKSISPVRVGAVLTCMAEPVPLDAFRPAFCDKANKVYLARNLRRDLLPSLPRPTCTTGLPRKDVLFRVRLQKWDVTALEIWERVYQRPWIDTVTFEFCQPVENMADYGREISRAGGITTLLLCCDFKPEEKEKLLTNFVQVGIDLWGAVRAGHKGWPAVGGHGGGRKWIIVFSGIMLGDKEMQSPEVKYPDVQFSEDQQTEYGKCWTGAGVVFTGINGRAGKRGRGPYEHLHPSRWPSTLNEDYRRSSTTVGWVGQALAARILHAEKLWNHDAYFDYVDRWMTEDDSEHVKEIKEATGKNYSAAFVRQKRCWDPFVNEMWATYRTSAGLSPINVPVAAKGGPGEVTIGANREFRVAGKPLLPLMLFGQGPEQIDDALAMGVNTFLGNGSKVSSRKFLDALAERGLYGVFGGDMEIVDHPNLLGLLHADQPDMFKILRGIDVTAGKGMHINPDFPLERLADGDKRQKAILGPLEGAQVTLKCKKPVTVQSLAVWLGDYKGFSVAKEAVFLGDGKEILKVTLEKRKGQQKFRLKEPATFKELTLKVLSVYPDKAKFGAVNEIEAFDKDGRDVPLYEPRKQLSIPPERVASAFRWMKNATARPVFLTLSPCFMKTVSGWDQATRERLYPEYVKHCDVAGVAVRAIPGGPTRPVRPGTADAVSELRAIAGSDRPAYALIEIPVGKASQEAAPQLQRVHADVWMAVIRGATAIGYVIPGAKRSGKRGAKKVTLKDVLGDDVLAELKQINEQISRLAAAILAAPAKVRIEVAAADGSPCHFKATDLGGETYVFVQRLGAPGTSAKMSISIQGLAAGTTVEVIDESRTIAAGEGRFADEFTASEVHVYKLSGRHATVK
jgi:hypothetical protein